MKHGDLNANIPKETPIEEVTLSQAVALLEARAARGGGKKRGTRRAPARGAVKQTDGATAKATPPKKPTAKKPAAKSAASKKKAPKKAAKKKGKPGERGA
ncbi:MAG TPA: topoisomerase C-terminal repeat-containing protein [Planctomycetaceae bacterium]|nr:topoisomerase C-terminal repeat-containing protein [Planctomycetaceae bacterium]